MKSYGHKAIMLLNYYAIVQEINDGIVTLNVIKSRAGSQGVLKMSIEFLNTIKTMENYRVERPIDLDDVDFEPLVGKDLYKQQIDGYYICREDARKIHKVLNQL